MSWGNNGYNGSAGPYRWAKLPDCELLTLRLSDLRLRLERSPALSARIAKVREELALRGLRFSPHFWLAEDWFSPDGIPGVAVPFYLAHPRLLRIERRLMGDVEGSTAAGCLRILRHEVGHAIDHAYLLHRRRDWREHFGDSSEPYPSSYRAHPTSRNFVLHLDSWYAQSHPDEDFAETFAVWLASRRGWRNAYQGWRALRKLEYVDALMQEIAGKRPIINSRARIEPLDSVHKTLREYYEEKRARRGAGRSPVYDRDLRRLFQEPANGCAGRPATAFIRQCRRELRTMLEPAAAQECYNLDQIVREMIGRCRELKLRAAGGPRLKQQFLRLLSSRGRKYIHSARPRVRM